MQATQLTDIPEHLQKLHDPPRQLWRKGVLPSSERPHIAIVGTRHPSDAGRSITRRLAGELASAGCIIVSGLAFGIDAEAHTAALDAGGQTIAVLASGVDQPGPPSSIPIATRILEHKQGCLLSEYAPGTPALKYQFIARNRIVSGLAQLTLVIEGGETSGTRSTAEFALQQGREVGAIPGSPLHPMSATPNALLKDGAHVITCTQDVLDILQITSTHISSNTTPSPIERFLQYGPQTFEEIQNALQQGHEECMSALTELELAQRITRDVFGRYCRKT
ncbi:MAG: DNA-processing protein DprA [Candidatus Andersenbacteria bacterium]|nr:DNA-processing protein DprA [Candidatus Andersenbacteria bacterium]